MPTGKKLNPNRVALQIGEKAIGKFIERRKMTDQEGKEFTVLLMEDKAGEKFSIREWAGLRMALNDALVKEGQWIEIERLADVKTQKGQDMQKYDIYEAEGPST